MLAIRQPGWPLGRSAIVSASSFSEIRNACSGSSDNLTAAREDVVEQPVVGRDIAAEHFARERVLVLEVIEEAALGEAGFRRSLPRSRWRQIPWRERRLPRFREFARGGFALAHPGFQNCTHGTVSPLPAARQHCRHLIQPLNSYHFAASWFIRTTGRLGGRDTMRHQHRRTWPMRERRIEVPNSRRC